MTTDDEIALLRRAVADLTDRVRALEARPAPSLPPVFSTAPPMPAVNPLWFHEPNVKTYGHVAAPYFSPIAPIWNAPATATT